MSYRNFCFTLNNYTSEQVEKLALWLNKSSTYYVYGFEVGESGTPHLQGYVEWRSSVEFKTVKNKFPTMHFEKRKGTPLEASEYCKKDGTYLEKGVLSKQGERSDLNEIGRAIINGTTMTEIALTHPGSFIRYNRGFQALRSAIELDRRERPHVQWNWGPTGCSKTYEACNMTIGLEPLSFYIKDGTCWWDGYEQQSVIVIDDFDGHWPFRDLLRLLDCYPYQGQRKGGYVKVNSPYIFITCEFPPEHFWTDNTLAQIMRRIDKVNHLNKPYNSKKTAEVNG